MSGTESKINLQGKDMEVVTLTPIMATSLLEANLMNRPIRDGQVKRIANQIREGKWQFNGDTIKIASDNAILDGQHRLWACIEAQKPITTAIIRGIPREAFSTIDTIRSMRTGGDVLALMGLEKYRSATSEGLKWVLRYQRDTIQNWRYPENRLENSDVEAAFLDHPNFIHAVEATRKLRGLANRSVLAAIYYIMANRNPEIADKMLNTLMNPSRVRVNDPFFQLRKYFLTENRKDPVVTFALCFKAANLVKNGKSVSYLTWRGQGDRPEKFPELEF